MENMSQYHIVDYKIVEYQIVGKTTNKQQETNNKKQTTDNQLSKYKITINKKPKRPPDGLKRHPGGFKEGPQERYGETCFINIFFPTFLSFLTKIMIIMYFTVRFGSPKAETLYFTMFYEVRRDQKSALQVVKTSRILHF